MFETITTTKPYNCNARLDELVTIFNLFQDGMKIVMEIEKDQPQHRRENTLFYQECMKMTANVIKKEFLKEKAEKV